MIYLDYAASTPVKKEVLDTFYDASIKYFANPNSSHKFILTGILAAELLVKKAVTPLYFKHLNTNGNGFCLIIIQAIKGFTIKVTKVIHPSNKIINFP